MVAFNFKRQFASDVESGQKRQTIRAIRKDKRQHCSRGDDLQLYTGMRTRHCRKLRDAVCVSVNAIEILQNNAIKIDGRALSPSATDKVARADGFKGSSDMVEWFSKIHTMPFQGYLIKWELL